MFKDIIGRWKRRRSRTIPPETSGPLWDSLPQQIIAEWKQFPQSFLRQKTISRVLHPNQQKLAQLYYAELLKSQFYQDVLRPQTSDSRVGTPHQFELLPQASPLTIQHMYYLNLLHVELGFSVPKSVSHIVEIGGGYGNFCRLVKRLGYNGRYIIADLEEMLELQKDYLCANDISGVEFSPLDMPALLPQQSATSLLIATFSVNEMPLPTRQALEPYYRHFDYLLFAHNRSFDGVDNIAYFENLNSLIADNGYTVRHHKDAYRNSWFMLCHRTSG